MSSSESLVGRVLDGKYQIVRLLGRGGMGEVYFGTHVQLERPVAVKVLHGDLVADESFAARFAREARTAARLEHPNAVHVYDFGSLESGSAYLVMEYIEGVSLRDVMRRNPRISLATVLELMRQAGGAVGAAHVRGIIHRDIKPENMMVRAGDDGRPVLKVVDFGLAKLLENQTSQLTKGSELIGTPRYMAPEQFSGGRVDERVDVYALGCVLFELLAGRTPFEGTFMEVAGRHVFAEVPSFASLGIELPAAVEAVVRHALEKDPAKRTATAPELVRELEAACASTEVLDRGDAITIPLPPPIPTVSQQSEVATGLDPNAFATRAANVETPTDDDFATRRSDSADVAPVAGVPSHPPTQVLEEAAVDPNTRVARPARHTALELEPPVPSRRRPWAGIVAVASAGVIGFGALAYWLGHQGPVVPQTTAPAITAPTPAVEATAVPAPVPTPTPEGGTAAAKPRRSTRPRTAEGLDGAEPPDVDIPEVEVNPDMPTPEQIRKLQKMAEAIQREQHRRAVQRARRQGRTPPPPPEAPPQ
jgi:serine/threonine protein kinase